MKYKKATKQKLLREIAKAKGVNGVRLLIQRYLSVAFRRALVEKVPEFFLLYYLGFRLPEHQRRWIRLWKIKYLLELAPRDHGKSWIFSYGLPLYDIYCDLIRNNLESVNFRFLQCSKTDDQAGKFCSQVRETIEYNVYLKQDFGDIRDPGEWHKGSFRCKRKIVSTAEKDLTYEKVGVLGAITGAHFNRVALDDILDDENTKTSERMEDIENWFWGTIWNMREIDTFYTMVGTRKNRRDIYSQVLGNPIWKMNVERAIIKYPMIEDPERKGYMKQGWLYVTDSGRTVGGYPDLKPGETIVDVELLTDDYEVLWPSIQKLDDNGDLELDPDTGKPKLFGWGIKELLIDRAAQGSTYFDREKQNSISAEEGSIFNKNWFAYFDNEELVYNATDGYYYLQSQLEKVA